MGKKELVSLLGLSSWCLMMVERLFVMVPQGCLRFVIAVFPDHTRELFLLSVTCMVLTVSYFVYLVSVDPDIGDIDGKQVVVNKVFFGYKIFLEG